MATVNVQQLKEAMTNLLNSREQAEFIETLNDFHSRRNIADFSYSLKNLLDTPAKRHLASMVRSVLPSADAATFDQILGSSYETQSLPRLPKNGNGTLYRATSTPNVTATYYQTVPSRGAKALRRSVPQNLHKLTHLPAFEAGNMGEIKTVHLDPPSSSSGLGFSIRGGAEHGIGIYVSYVDVGSVAERAGLIPGDQILGVNGHSFLKASHADAAKIIKAARKLQLQVRNVGRVPGSFETHQGYSWVDPVGRSVSPPPEIDRVGRYDTRGERKSGLMLLKDSNERKVNVVVADQKMLGLMIRGGNEFGLGIYITGVDRGSVAENAGLKVGDHILDVNGQSFLDISHSEAVKVLKSSKHMMMTIKDVGKIPYARTTYDHTEWVTERELPRRPHSAKPTINLPSNGHSPFTPLESSSTDSVFTRGAGSQLMHNAFNSQQATYGMVEEQARQLLNDNERGTLNYYLNEYQKGHVTADSLVLALCQLLNTPSKFSLMTEIRGLILPKDIDKFDTEVMEREVEAMKGTADNMSEQSLDTLSGNSQLSYSSNRDSIDADSDHIELSTPRPPSYSLMENGDDLEQLRVALNQISDQMKQEEEVRLTQQTVSTIPRAVINRQLNGRDQPREVVVAEVHPRPSSPKQQYDDVRSPSEDSGVEMNGNSSGGTDSQSHAHTRQYDNNWLKLHTTSDALKPMTQQQKKRVTVSQQDPIIINDVLHDGDISSQEDEVYFHRESAKVKHKVLRPTHSRGLRSDLMKSELLPPNRQQRDRSPVYEEISASRGINGYSTIPRASRDKSPGRRASPHRSRSPGHSRAQMNSSPVSFIDLNNHREASPARNGGFTMVVQKKTSDTHLRARSPHRREPSPYRTFQVTHTGSYNPHKRDASPFRSHSPYRRDQSPSRNSINTGEISALLQDLDADSHYANKELIPAREMSPPSYNSLTRDRSPYRRRQREESPHRQRGSSPARRSRKDEIDSTQHRITVYKTKPTLGIAIEGGANTRQPLPRIIHIQPGGSAHDSGGIKVGQTILEVNGRTMNGLEHRQAAQAIARAFKDRSSDRMELVVLDA